MTTIMCRDNPSEVIKSYEALEKQLTEAQAELARYRRSVELGGQFGDTLMLNIRNILKGMAYQRVRVLILPELEG